MIIDSHITYARVTYPSLSHTARLPFLAFLCLSCFPSKKFIKSLSMNICYRVELNSTPFHSIQSLLQFRAIRLFQLVAVPFENYIVRTDRNIGKREEKGGKSLEGSHIQHRKQKEEYKKSWLQGSPFLYPGKPGRR